MREQVLFLVKLIPESFVASYGQVAHFTGRPRAARQVGWILNQSEERTDIPWWRVVNNQGKITIKGSRYNDRFTQKNLLESEGIKVDKDFNLDINKHRWRPERETLIKFGLSQEQANDVIKRFY